MGYISLFLMIIAAGVLCAYVLYNAAEKHDRHRWLWAIIGFFGNVFGIMAFRIFVGKLT